MRQSTDVRDPLTKAILGAAIEVHRELGPGLLESAYQRCLAHEMGRRSLSFTRHPTVPLVYKDLVVDRAFEPDFIVDGRVVVEVKTVAALREVHAQQVRTYLKVCDLRVGLLLNFGAPALIDGGIRRIRRR